MGLWDWAVRHMPGALFRNLRPSALRARQRMRAARQSRRRRSPRPADACRLNVALTRARHNLLVVGCAPALQQSSQAFAALLARCRSTPGGYVPSGRLPGAAALAAQQAAPGNQQAANHVHATGI